MSFVRGRVSDHLVAALGRRSADSCQVPKNTIVFGMPEAAEIDHHLRRTLMSVLCGKLLAVLSFGHHIETIIVTDHPSLKYAAVDFIPGGFDSLSFNERECAEFCGYVAAARLSGRGTPVDFPQSEKMVFERAEKILANGTGCRKTMRHAAAGHACLPVIDKLTPGSKMAYRGS